MRVDASTTEWPTERVDAGAVRAWIGDVLPGRPAVEGPTVTHRSNAWGVTARFVAHGDTGATEVVLKANFLPMSFSGAAVYELLGRRCPDDVPHLLASVEEPRRRWALFAAFEGETVGSIGELGPLVEVARTIARIQVTVAGSPEMLTSDLPRSPIERMPDVYDALLANVERRFVAATGGDAEAFATAHGLPAVALSTLRAGRPDVARWCEELAAGPWPPSIHHVDLHPNNAVLRQDGTVLIFDWEEGDLGFPLFVLDKLLLAAEEWWGVDGASTVRDAYLDALPWGTRGERERAFAVAQLLSPFRYAAADLRFADAMAWDPAGQVARWLGVALRRWAALKT